MRSRNRQKPLNVQLYIERLYIQVTDLVTKCYYHVARCHLHIQNIISKKLYISISATICSLYLSTQKICNHKQCFFKCEFGFCLSVCVILPEFLLDIVGILLCC